MKVQIQLILTKPNMDYYRHLDPYSFWVWIYFRAVMLNGNQGIQGGKLEHLRTWHCGRKGSQTRTTAWPTTIEFFSSETRNNKCKKLYYFQILSQPSHLHTSLASKNDEGRKVQYWRKVFHVHSLVLHNAIGIHAHKSFSAVLRVSVWHTPKWTVARDDFFDHIIVSMIRIG